MLESFALLDDRSRCLLVSQDLFSALVQSSANRDDLGQTACEVEACNDKHGHVEAEESRVFAVAKVQVVLVVAWSRDTVVVDDEQTDR